MEQTAKLPSKRIVFLQSYDYIFEMLMPGKNWAEYGITDVITTTQKQKEYVEELFLNRVNQLFPSVDAAGRVAEPEPLDQTRVWARSALANVAPDAIAADGWLWFSVAPLATNPYPARVAASAEDVPAPNAIVPHVPCSSGFAVI
jgi:hypothetical protein